MVGVGLDFSQTLALPPEAGNAAAGPRVLFYPGSSIGNFTPAEALAFLRQAHAACGPVKGSGLLIGVDLVKDAVELQAAYDDALGVTAAFNRNMLLHINRLAGCDFKLADWAHVGLYNTALNRIEMHVQAQRPVTITWPGGSRAFAKAERIHTESSYKWTVESFAQLLRDAGFQQPVVWTDAVAGGEGRFAVMWAGAAPASTTSPSA
jgi:uncharacterized SAM-dependent methyltransferase